MNPATTSIHEPTNCRLSLLKRWSAENHFFGVRISDGRCSLDGSAFACCGGSGVSVVSDVMREAMLCGLSKRWNLLSGVIEHWQRLEQRSITFLPSAKSVEAVCQGYFDRCLRRDRGKIVSSADYDKPPNMTTPWALAAVMTWHFEVLPLITRVGREVAPVQMWQDQMRRFPGMRTIVFVDGVTDMWNPSRVESMEAIIAFAYERRLPVWIFEQKSDLPAQSAQVSGRRGFKNAVKSRIDETRLRSAVSWLSAQGLSRLCELCEVDVPQLQPLQLPNQV